MINRSASFAKKQLAHRPIINFIMSLLFFSFHSSRPTARHLCAYVQMHNPVRSSFQALMCWYGNMQTTNPHGSKMIKTNCGSAHLFNLTCPPPLPLPLPLLLCRKLKHPVHTLRKVSHFTISMRHDSSTALVQCCCLLGRVD